MEVAPPYELLTLLTRFTLLTLFTLLKLLHTAKTLVCTSTYFKEKLEHYW